MAWFNEPLMLQVSHVDGDEDGAAAAPEQCYFVDSGTVFEFGAPAAVAAPAAAAALPCADAYSACVRSMEHGARARCDSLHAK